MPHPRAISRRPRRRAVLQLWLANICLGIGLGTSYLVHVPEGDSPRLWLFALPALVSSILVLTLVPGCVFLLAERFVRSERVLGPLQAFSWTVFQVALFTDTRIYNMFRYHVNGQVLNLIYQRGSEDAIHLGWQVWTAVSLGLFGVGLAELALWTWLRRRADKQVLTPERPLGRFPRPALLSTVALLLAVFVEKTIYAQADLSRDRQVTALARLFPLYARLPMEDLASRVLGREVLKPPRVELDGFELNYPLAKPDIAPDGPRPGIFVVVIDCLRQDVWTQENTPNLERWGQSGRRFMDHVSSGNSTRYGLFGMLYGLHGSYWFSVLQEGRSPVLVDSLNEIGYEMGVFSSASMNYPEMRDTAWSEIPGKVHDEFGEDPPWRRDELAGEKAIEWLGEQAAREQPFFGFLLLDSPHQTYSHPPEATPFSPSADELDYMAMTRNDGPRPDELERVRNRYLNAVHHADAVTGRVLAALEELGLADGTLVIVTGDHGEEFRECGFFGHTSAFTPEQVAVPFVVRGPGFEAGEELRPTSHLDFAPTVLEILGADPADRAAWCLGRNLLAPESERNRVISGWNELGVWTPEGILRVPLSLFEFDIELYDYRWRYQFDDGDALQTGAQALVQLGRECNRFLR